MALWYNLKSLLVLIIIALAILALLYFHIKFFCGKKNQILKSLFFSDYFVTLVFLESGSF